MQVSREPARWLRPYVRRYYGFEETAAYACQDGGTFLQDAAEDAS